MAHPFDNPIKKRRRRRRSGPIPVNWSINFLPSRGHVVDYTSSEETEKRIIPPPPPFPSANLNEHFNDARDVKATIVAKSDRRARFEPRCTEADNG